MRVFIVLVFQTKSENVNLCFCLPVLITVSGFVSCLCLSAFWFVKLYFCVCECVSVCLSVFFGR